MAPVRHGLERHGKKNVTGMGKKQLWAREKAALDPE